MIDDRIFKKALILELTADESAPFEEQMAAMAEAHRQVLAELCESGKLIRAGVAARFNQVTGEGNFGIVQSLTLEDNQLKLKAGEREGWGYKPFEATMMWVPGARIFPEKDDKEIHILGGGPNDVTQEWVFYLPD